MAEPKRRLSLQQRNLESRKQALQLARSRTVQQIQSAENPRYREVLEQALTELDEQLSKLG